MNQDDSNPARRQPLMSQDEQAIEQFPPAPFPDDPAAGNSPADDPAADRAADDRAAFDAPDARSTQVIQLLSRVAIPAMPEAVTSRLFAALASESVDRVDSSGWWTGRATPVLDAELLPTPFTSATDKPGTDKPVADGSGVDGSGVNGSGVGRDLVVVDLAQARAPRTARLPRLLQLAAAIAVLFVGGAVVSQVVGSRGGGAISSSLDSAASVAGQPQVASGPNGRPNFSAEPSSPAAGSNAAVADATAKSSPLVPAEGHSAMPGSVSSSVPSAVVSGPPGTLVEANGHAYSAATSLAEQVQALVFAWKSSQPSSGSGAIQASSLPPADVAPGLQSLAVDQARISACASALSNGASNVPLAIDLGTYDDTPAAVYLLSGGPDTVTAWVVGMDCGSGGSEDVLAAVTVPR